MADENTQRPRRYYYQIPTRLNVEDKLITFGPLSLTLRQATVLVLGGCLATQMWRILEIMMLLSTFGLIVRIVLTSLPVLITCIAAFVRIADRYCEDWAMVLWRYYRLPKVYVWRPVPIWMRKPEEWTSSRQATPSRRDAKPYWMMDEESEER